MIGYYPNSLRENLFLKQQRLRGRLKTDTRVAESSDILGRHNVEDEQKVLESQEQEFSRSLDLTTRIDNSGSQHSAASSFVQSVVVAGSEDGRYAIYSRTGSHDQRNHGNGESDHTQAFLDSKSYEHNIGNPWLQQHKKGPEGSSPLFTQQKNSVTSKNSIKSRRKSKPKLHTEQQCDCGKYHSHKLGTQDLSLSIPSVVSSTETQVSFPGREQTVANHVTIANVFWKPHLAFCDYKHGDKTMLFQSLWPSAAVIEAGLIDGIEDTGLRSALWELCLLSIASGPLSVLKSILDLKFLRIDHQFENDPGLLHMACLLRNVEATKLVIDYRVSPKLKDKSGRTAGQVCYCGKMRKQLPVWYQSSFLSDRNKTPQVLVPSLQDKYSIFSLAPNPRNFYELQKKLQSFDFPVNKECNEDGDYLIHTACKTGLSHLPLIMCLVKLQEADIDLYNSAGMTPLMIVARNGDTILCDLLLCVFGADPNIKNNENGKTALHYAAIGNHVNVVNCLLKRDADVNIEDDDHCRADDMLVSTRAVTDCSDIIQLHRVQRCQALTEMVIGDVVYPINLRKTDLTVTDPDGFTLVMLAVINDRIHNLETLLSVSSATIDAQHIKTGLTSLAMAAKKGFCNACKILLKYRANPAIPDMQDYLPLHQAVLGNHEKTVEVFFEYEPATYVGVYKALRFCRKSSIHDTLTKAWEMRQEKIVCPQLRIASMEGNADKLYCILEHGDNVDTKSDLNNKTALFAAVENSHLDVVKLLIERGADLHKRDNETANTVLHVVCKTGHLETALYLLQFCQPNGENSLKSQIDVNAVNNDRKTALQIASGKGYIKLISLLITKGATTALLNSQGALFTCPEFEGAHIKIENHRLRHTQEVMTLVVDKSRRSLEKLKAIWVPRFDHNLRDKEGNTPLMVACRAGRVETVKYLLLSAVYANHITSDNESDSGSVDSGVPDLPPWKSRPEIRDQEEIIEKMADFDETMALGASCDVARSLSPSDFLNTIPASSYNAEGSHMNAFLTDVERPKGLYIFHDGIVSHVCAVNLYTGNTPLHCAIEGGDSEVIVQELLEADSAIINMQNSKGLTPVHMACKHGRKKSLQLLLNVPGLDLNLRSLNGGLAEDMAVNNGMRKLMKKARIGRPLSSQTSNVSSGDSKSIAGFTESLPQSIGKASTIDFDKINNVYQSMKVDLTQKTEK